MSPFARSYSWLWLQALLVILGLAVATPASAALPPPDTGFCYLRLGYEDADCDGFRSPVYDYYDTCGCGSKLPPALGDEDCDDWDPSVNPKGVEVCDGIDQDCDGSIDEGLSTPYTHYYDGDGDGYGDKSSYLKSCDKYPPRDYTADSTDCDDKTYSTNPGGKETCNYVDDDCDGTVDDGVGYSYYKDADADGYGAGSAVASCSSTTPSGYSTKNTDCNDSLKAIYPGATETCNGADDDCDTVIDDGVLNTYYKDADGDAYGVSTSTTTACALPSGYSTKSTDCNDAVATTYPGATETCNGVDDDCDGTADDGLTFKTYYKDTDGDGYGSTTSTTSCASSAPSGYSATGGDCNDASTAIRPGATETCNSIDDDCDGSTDEGLTSYTFYKDSDGDGYGSTTTTSSCSSSVPSGYSSSGGDCNDASTAIRPGATETCNSTDDDCDGSTDEGLASYTYYRDADADGYGLSTTTLASCATSAPSGYSATSGDCNDASSAIKPGATETCNSTDDDCDGTTDEGVTTTYYKDSDGDGYGNVSSPTAACSLPSGYASNSTDCDDTSSAIRPGAAETCNSKDDDCDGTVDEGVKTTFYKDTDADGYGVTGTTTSACTKPTGYASVGGDCNDASAAVSPGATETCNSVDDDCDGSTDEGVLITYYKDTDADGYGISSSTTTACTKPSGYSASGTDCNDAVASVYPGATETCNSVDDDCDGTTDEGVKTTYYKDADGDTYGTPTSTAAACSAPFGYVTNSTDCNDASAAVKPGATETCNSIDDDCDSTVDEGVKTTFYKDADADGYGGSVTTTACTEPSGYSGVSTDCNDASATVYPGAPEACDGVDNDCDGTIDGVIPTWYADADADGYGTTATTLKQCSQPTGYVGNSEDCNDASAAVSPADVETCNAVDDDCDGVVDDGVKLTWYADGDADGYGASTATGTASCTAPSGHVSNATDCNDSSKLVNPGASETCNSIDDDCDGSVDESAVGAPVWYLDADGDGFGDSAVTYASCDAPSGFADNADDCNDGEASVGGPDTWYADYDSDGWGVATETTESCELPLGFSEVFGDCDDADDMLNPDATEAVNGFDDDCDGIVDNDTPAYDDDGDGFTENGGDCDDSDEFANPAGVESCNGIDEDCDGTVDNGTECYDDDGDSYDEGVGDCNDGDPDVNPGMAEIPENGVDDDCDGIIDDGNYDGDGDGYSDTAGDCDPHDGTVYPGAEELPDGKDNDCDEIVDEGTDDYDDDGDTFTENDGDCDDGDADAFPGGTETADGVDEDCDGTVDEGTVAYDDDGDGATEQGGDCDDANGDVGPSEVETPANGIDDDCDGDIDEGGDPEPEDLDNDGFVAGEDCDDADGGVFPGATEVCNEIDDDCSGTVDDGDACAGPDDKEEKSCGCASPTGGVGLLPLLIAGLAFRRRRS